MKDVCSLNILLSTATTSESNNEPEPPLDYPRPTADSPHSPVHHRTEEEQLPKKEKKQGHSDKKVREYAHVKSELTRPTKDNVGLRKGTSGIRISQPEGKVLSV